MPVQSSATSTTLSPSRFAELGIDMLAEHRRETREMLSNGLAEARRRMFADGRDVMTHEDIAASFATVTRMVR